MNRPIVPTLLAIADADALEDWLSEDAEPTDVVACVGMDFDGFPFTAEMDMQSGGPATATVAGSSNRRPATALEFPVWVITSTTEKKE